MIELSELGINLIDDKATEMTTSWLKEEMATDEFNVIADEWNTGDLTGQSDTLLEGWPSIAVRMAGVTGEPPEDWKMKFEKNNITAYFQSCKVINFDMEMKSLDKERLLELMRIIEPERT